MKVKVVKCYFSFKDEIEGKVFEATDALDGDVRITEKELNRFKEVNKYSHPEYQWLFYKSEIEVVEE